MGSIKSEFQNKEKAEFQLFFLTSNIGNISDMDKICAIRVSTPSVSLFEIFSRIDPLLETITKFSSNEIRETFFGGLK